MRCRFITNLQSLRMSRLTLKIVHIQKFANLFSMPFQPFTPQDHIDQQNGSACDHELVPHSSRPMPAKCSKCLRPFTREQAAEMGHIVPPEKVVLHDALLPSMMIGDEYLLRLKHAKHSDLGPIIRLKALHRVAEGWEFEVMETRWPGIEKKD